MRCKDGFYKSIRQFRLTHRIGTGTFNRKYPFFLAARGGYWYGDAVIFRDEADRICDCPHADTLPDSGAADSAALRSLLDRLWLLLAAIVAHAAQADGLMDDILALVENSTEAEIVSVEREIR